VIKLSRRRSGVIGTIANRVDFDGKVAAAAAAAFVVRVRRRRGRNGRRPGHFGRRRLVALCAVCKTDGHPRR